MLFNHRHVDVRGRTTKILICLLIGLVAPGTAAAKDARSGASYTSKTKLFRVVVPKVGGRDVRFQVSEGGDKKPANRYDEVVFRIPDYGVLFRAGVRRITANLRSMTQGDLASSGLTFMAVSLQYGGQLPGDAKMLSSEEVTTAHGSAVAAVGEVEHGSHLVVSQVTFSGGKMQKTEQPRNNAYVAVVVLQKGDFLIYACAQYDLDGERSIGDMKTAALEMVQTLTLLTDPEK